jgi:hypothetical protein
MQEPLLRMEEGASRRKEGRKEGKSGYHEKK